MKGIIGFIFLILSIVTVHEGGHLIAAKIFNVYCSEFSIGMGPEIFRKKNKETDFTLRWLPIGGYCSMAGESEDGLEERTKIEVPKERTIKGIAKWKQVIIYLAGVTMNFIMGYLVIIIALMTITLSDIKVTNVIPGSPADGVFKKGDIVLKVNGNDIKSIDDIKNEDYSTIYTVLRDGQQQDLILTLNEGVEPGFEVDNAHLSFSQAFVEAKRVWMNFATAIIDGIKSMFSHPENISGVVGIYSYTAEAVDNGWTEYLLLMALISINVGVFNLLPLPVMDGGRVAILIAEIIIGHELDKELEKKIMLICAGLLVLLMLWAFGLDIYRLITGQI